MVYILSKIIERKNPKDTQKGGKGEDAHAVEYVNKCISQPILLLRLNTCTIMKFSGHK
jgi:hypothetical protein